MSPRYDAEADLEEAARRIEDDAESMEQRRPPDPEPDSAPGPPPHTTHYATVFRCGLAGLFAGESLGRELDRVLAQINAEHRRVVFMIRDRWSLWRWLGVLIGTALSLGFWSRLPGYIIIAEARAASVTSGGETARGAVG